MTTKANRGGARPGAGRKPKGKEPMVVVPIRMQPAQRAKLKRLGGAPWVREKIDQTKDPMKTITTSEIDAFLAEAGDSAKQLASGELPPSCLDAAEALSRFARGEINRAELEAVTRKMNAATKQKQRLLRAAKAALQKTKQ